jgi:hypothetical protein
LRLPLEFSSKRILRSIENAIDVMLDVDSSFKSSSAWRIARILVEPDMGEGLPESLKINVGGIIHNQLLVEISLFNVCIVIYMVKFSWTIPCLFLIGFGGRKIGKSSMITGESWRDIVCA